MPNQESLDKAQGLTQEEKNYIEKTNDMEKVFKDIGTDKRKIYNEVMANIHIANNKDKLNKEILGAGLTKDKIIEDLKKDAPEQLIFKQYEEALKRNPTDKVKNENIALLQALAAKCIDNITYRDGNNKILTLLKDTDYFNATNPIDGYMGPNTTLIFSLIAKADLKTNKGNTSDVQTFNGEISKDLILKMYRVCNPGFGFEKDKKEIQKELANDLLKPIKKEEVTTVPPTGDLIKGKYEKKKEKEEVTTVPPTGDNQNKEKEVTNNEVTPIDKVLEDMDKIIEGYLPPKKEEEKIVIPYKLKGEVVEKDKKEVKKEAPKKTKEVKIKPGMEVKEWTIIEKPAYKNVNELIIKALAQNKKDVEAGKQNVIFVSAISELELVTEYVNNKEKIIALQEENKILEENILKKVGDAIFKRGKIAENRKAIEGLTTRNNNINSELAGFTPVKRRGLTRKINTIEDVEQGESYQRLQKLSEEKEKNQ